MFLLHGHTLFCKEESRALEKNVRGNGKEVAYWKKEDNLITIPLPRSQVKKN